MFVKFEPGEKYTKKKLDDQELSDNLDDFEDAGYILGDNEIVIDIDCLDFKTIEKLIETFNIKTKTVWTDRGVHFYYKRPKVFRRAQGICAFGFPVEYKHNGNTYAITVKHNGIERKVDNPDTLSPMPEYFNPVQTKSKLLGLNEGDGRNKLLYSHKQKIYKIGNTRKILQFINDYIFDEPLSEPEFAVVARDQVFEAEKDGENIIADMIMREHKVVRHQGMLFYEDEGQYTFDEDRLHAMVYDYCQGQKTRYVDEVIKQMKYRAEIVPDDIEFKIKLENGYLYDGKFYPYQFNGFTPYSIDIVYDPDAEPVKEIDDYLDMLSNGDPNYRDLILEVIATPLITNFDFKRHLAKFFVFVGKGGNGKGTLLEIITKILGAKNISANSINELADERYVSTLVGKLANLGDDIIDEPIRRKEMKILKNLSTGDRIQIRRLYENAVSVKLMPTLIFTSNHILKTFDKDYSYKRRAVWCPMYQKPKESDPEFISRVTTDEGLKYWMRLIVEAYERLYKRKRYTGSKTVWDFNEAYHKENNNTIEFVESLEDEEIDGERVVKIYDDYTAWCEANGETPLNKKQLRSTIEDRGFKITQLRRKNMNDGKTYRGYKKLKGSQPTLLVL